MVFVIPGRKVRQLCYRLFTLVLINRCLEVPCFFVHVVIHIVHSFRVFQMFMLHYSLITLLSYELDREPLKAEIPEFYLPTCDEDACEI